MLTIMSVGWLESRREEEMERFFLDLIRPCFAMGFSGSWLGERLRAGLLLVAWGFERDTLMTERSGEE